MLNIYQSRMAVWRLKPELTDKLDTGVKSLLNIERKPATCCVIMSLCPAEVDCEGHRLLRVVQDFGLHCQQPS